MRKREWHPSCVLRELVCAAAAVFIAVSCGPSREESEPVVVRVDAGSRGSQISIAAYLPAEVVVHPGDRVVFHSTFTGEPHTVTMGRLVDAGLAAHAAAVLRGDRREPPELKRLPALAPADLVRGGRGAAGECFVSNGAATRDSAAACSKGPKPRFNGRQSFFSSGVLAPGQRFAIDLSASITPGAYGFFCLVHRARMSGDIKVVDPADPVRTAGEVRARGERERLAAVNTLRAAAEASAGAAPDAALAGVLIPELPNSVFNAFLPARASVPVGGSATWNVFGTHVIAFNPPPATRPAISTEGGFRFNPRALAAVGGPAPPEDPPIATASDTDIPEPTVVDGGAWDGRGFRSSGVMFSFPPALLAYKLTFTAPGNYEYRCLIRPEMRGAVRVG